jgi:hypothetical protein
MDWFFAGLEAGIAVVAMLPLLGLWWLLREE